MTMDRDAAKDLYAEGVAVGLELGKRLPVTHDQLLAWAAQLVRVVAAADLTRDVDREIAEPVRSIALEMRKAAEAVPR